MYLKQHICDKRPIIEVQCTGVNCDKCDFKKENAKWFILMTGTIIGFCIVIYISQLLWINRQIAFYKATGRKYSAHI